jgi:hypothetical protein
MVEYGDESYITAEGRMVAKQAQIITNLNDQIRRLKADLVDLEKLANESRPNHLMYLAIMKAVQEHPHLQGIWDELVTAMRLLEVKF